MNDPSSAPVPGAAVRLVNEATDALLTTTTDPAGLFRFLIVPAGRYSLKIQASGFKAYNQRGIELASSETRDLGKLSLELGTPSESVSVDAVTTPVQTARVKSQR